MGWQLAVATLSAMATDLIPPFGPMISAGCCVWRRTRTTWNMEHRRPSQRVGSGPAQRW
jgi:hypothetical protein